MADPDRLCVIIADSNDADRLMERLVRGGMPATKIGSTGGFLRRGNATVLSGVAEEDVAAVVEIVGEECHARREFIPVQTLPFLGDSALIADPVEVRAGGAVVFVIEIERFVRT